MNWTEILKSQRPSVFPIYSHYIEDLKKKCLEVREPAFFCTLFNQQALGRGVGHGLTHQKKI
jgi:hypothetical protein